MGNNNIHLITNQDYYTLQINMRRFNGESGEVKYSTFKVDAAYEKYTFTWEDLEHLVTRGVSLVTL